ncbi:nitrous oxide reductase family maturation protein NosD [Thermodesulfobacteriota bacterium]
MKSSLLISVIVLFTFAPWATFADTIHVPADQPTIQAGIDAAVRGDIVLVAPGTYFENITFRGKKISVQGEAGVEETIIDGNNTGSVVRFWRGETEDSLIKGFTIRNGRFALGGGISCVFASPMISDCKIIENHSEGMGGGILCLGSSPVIRDCTVFGNRAEPGVGMGGGIMCALSHAVIENCQISYNKSYQYGSGIFCYYSSPTIRDSSINDNSFYDHSLGDGGIALLGSSPLIANCEIKSNGEHVYAPTCGILCTLLSKPTITNCTISHNTADGISCQTFGNPVITNCTITENSRWGIDCEMYSFPRMTNCTISGNWDGGIYSYQSFPTMRNSILWGNADPRECQYGIDGGSIMSAGYSDMEGGHQQACISEDSTLLRLAGNIDADPLFVGADDYHLQGASPCIDAGNPKASFMDACFPPSMGTERNDMGAYGGPGACDWPMDPDKKGVWLGALFSSEITFQGRK